MQMLNIALVVLCCWAGVAYIQAVKEPCTDTCSQGLVCQEGTCRMKIDGACTKDSTDECVVTAAACSTETCVCPNGATDTDKEVCACTDDNKVFKGDMSKCVLKAGETGCTDDCLDDATCNSGTCECNDKFVPSSDNAKCLKIAGEQCTDAADCLTGATCEGGPPTVCTCPSVTSTDKTKCQEKIGDACDAQKVCIDNADCSSSKCACKTDFLASFDKMKCAKAPGKSCDANMPCGENAQCTNGNCACKTGFTNKEGERCGKKAEADCEASSECVPNAECKEKKCKCMDGYSADDDKFCSGASAVMASLTLLLAALVASLWM